MADSSERVAQTSTASRPDATLPPPLPKGRGSRVTAPPPPPAAGAERRSNVAPPPLPPRAARSQRPSTEVLSERPAERPDATWATEAVAAYTAEAETTKDQARLGRLHHEIGRLYDSPLLRDAEAVEHFRRALKLIPGHPPSLRALRLCLLRRGDYVIALPLFDQEAECHEDATVKGQLAYQKGVLLHDRLRRKDAALAAFESAVALHPQLAAAWDAIADVATVLGDQRKAEQALSAAANLAEQDPKRRSALLTRRAQLLELKLGDADQAAELYDVAYRLDPKNSLARLSLERLLYSKERFSDLAELLRHEGVDRSGALQDLEFAAALLSHRLRRHPESLVLLREAEAKGGGDDPALLEMLAEAYAESGNHAALADVTARRVEMSQDAAEKVALLKLLGRIREDRLEDAEGAIVAYEAAAALAPRDHDVVSARDRLYTLQRNDDALLSLWESQVEYEPELEVRVELLTRMGRLLRQRGRTEEAAKALSDAQCLAPESVEVFRALEGLYQSEQKTDQLCSLYRHRVDQSGVSDGEQVSLLLKVANLEEGPLNKPNLAAHTYRQVLKLQPNHGPALAALQHVAARAGLHDELLEALELEVSRAESDRERAALLCRAAQVLYEQMQDRQGAIARLQRGLKAYPAHTPSLLLLERIQRDEGRHEELLKTLETRLSLTKDKAQRANLLLHMSGLAQDRLSDQMRALGFARRAVSEQPDDVSVRRHLAELLRAQDDQKGLAEALEAELPSIEQEERKALCAYRIALLYELRLSDLTRALHYYDVALGYDPDLRVAFDGWARIRMALSDYKALAPALETRAASEQQRARRAGLWLWAADLWSQRIGDPKKAELALRKAQEDLPPDFGLLLMRLSLEHRIGDPAGEEATLRAMVGASQDASGKRAALHAVLRFLLQREDDQDDGTRLEVLSELKRAGELDGDSLESLRQLYVGRGNVRAAGAVDKLASDSALEPGVRAALLCRHAETLSSKDAEGGAAYFRQALFLDPQNLGAVRGLGRLAMQGKDVEALREAATEELRVGGNRALASKYIARVAALCDERNDPESATEALQTALEYSPDNADVADRLLAHLQESGQILRMVDVLRRAAECAATVERRRDLWLRMSEVQRAPLENLSGALTAAQKAVDADPKHLPAALNLARLHRHNRRWDEAVKLLNRAVKLAQPDTEREVLHDAYLELASIHEEHLDDAASAVSCLRTADDLGELDPRVLARLSRLQSQCGDHDAAIATAQRLLDAAEGPAERADALVLLGRAQAAGQTDGATDSLQDAVALTGPRSAAGVALRAQLEQDAVDPKGYASAVARFCKTATGDALEEALLDLAEFQANTLGDAEQACETLQEAKLSTTALRWALARYQVQSEDNLGATDTLRTLIEEDPASAQYHALLVEAERSLDRMERAAAASEVLVVLDAAEAEHKELLLTEQDREVTSVLPRLSVETLESAICDRERGLLIEKLLRTLRPAAMRLFPKELSAYSVTADDRISDDTEHPLTLVANTLARRLQAPEFELYVHRSRSHGVVLEMNEPGIILVPSQLLEMPQAQQRFLLARPMLAMTLGLELLLKLTPRELQILLSAACRHSSKSFGAGLTSEEVLNQQTRQVQKSLPRRNRKTLDTLIQQYIALRPEELDAWVVGRTRGLQRVAALSAGNLPLVVQRLRTEQKDHLDLDGPALVRSSESVADLVRYWTSDEANALRMQLRVG